MIGSSGERGPVISVPAARHDDDDDVNVIKSNSTQIQKDSSSS